LIYWLIDWLAGVSAAFIALRSIVIVDLLGIEKLTSAFGFISLFQGFVALAGLPINGEYPFFRPQFISSKYTQGNRRYQA